MSARSGVAEDRTWTPEFPGQRPPFQPGHELTLRHGGYSPRLRSERAREVLAELLDVAPPDWLEQVDQAALESWATAEGVCRQLREWLTEHGHLDDSGKPRPASDLLLRWERRAAAERRRLGFDPLSRSEMQVNKTTAGAVALRSGLAALVDRGQELAARDLAGESIDATGEP